MTNKFNWLDALILLALAAMIVWIFTGPVIP